MKVILEQYLISVQLAGEHIARTEAAMSELVPQGIAREYQPTQPAEKLTHPD